MQQRHLQLWSSTKELHSRLREQVAPIYGTKDVLFRRLCEYGQIAARKKRDEDYLETRRKELAVATEPGDTKDPPWSKSNRLKLSENIT